MNALSTGDAEHPSKNRPRLPSGGPDLGNRMRKPQPQRMARLPIWRAGRAIGVSESSHREVRDRGVGEEPWIAERFPEVYSIDPAWPRTGDPDPWMRCLASIKRRWDEAQRGKDAADDEDTRIQWDFAVITFREQYKRVAHIGPDRYEDPLKE